VSAARRPLGKAVVLLAIAMAVAFALFSWNNPHLSNRYDVRLALIPDATFSRVYDGWFARTTLEPGRVLAVACFLVTAYAALTVFWRPIQRALGWFLIPLGQATLYIFVLHILFVVAVANAPVLSSSVLLGTLTDTVVLALFWVMVRRRFLFGVVPR
jgi:fucose 4-O-acetylase-like acetyltransferase